MPSVIATFADEAARKVEAWRSMTLPPFPTVSSYGDDDLSALVRLLEAFAPNLDVSQWHREASSRIIDGRFGPGIVDFLIRLDGEISRALDAGCNALGAGLLDCKLFTGDVVTTNALAGIFIDHGQLALGFVRSLPDAVRSTFPECVPVPIAGGTLPAVVLGPAAGQTSRRWTTLDYVRRATATWAARQRVADERRALDEQLARQRYEEAEKRRAESYPAQMGRLLALEAKVKQLEEQQIKPEPKRRAKTA